MRVSGAYCTTTCALPAVTLTSDGVPGLNTFQRASRSNIDCTVILFVTVPAASLTGMTLVVAGVPLVRSLIFLFAIGHHVMKSLSAVMRRSPDSVVRYTVAGVMDALADE